MKIQKKYFSVKNESNLRMYCYIDLLQCQECHNTAAQNKLNKTKQNTTKICSLSDNGGLTQSIIYLAAFVLNFINTTVGIQGVVECRNRNH